MNAAGLCFLISVILFGVSAFVTPPRVSLNQLAMASLVLGLFFVLV